MSESYHERQARAAAQAKDYFLLERMRREPENESALLAAREAYREWFCKEHNGISPWCSVPDCGKFALPNGFCRGHDSLNRRPMKRRRRRVNECGHPDRPHHAGGACKECYRARRKSQRLVTA